MIKKRHPNTANVMFNILSNTVKVLQNVHVNSKEDAFLSGRITESTHTG